MIKFRMLLSVTLFLVVISTLVACGGGGGGASGASVPADEYTTHNEGGWGGGDGSGGSGSGGNITVQGSTTLVVISYTYNGQDYPDLTSLTRALKDNNATGQFTIPFTVTGESSPRTARITKTSDGYKLEHQYKATCIVNNNTTLIFYYIADGINLTVLTTSDMTGWQCAENGQVYGAIITGVRGDITLTPVYVTGNLPGQTCFIKTDLDNGTNYEIDNTRTVNYAAMTGLTVNSDNTGCLTVTPLPSVLYTETQSGTTISLASYDVTVTVGGTAIPLSFTPSDTKAVKIDKIPLGTSVSASAVITVTGTGAYTTLNTETTSIIVQASSSTATMYVKYPIEFNKSSAYMSSTSLTGTMPEYYTSNSPLTLPVATNDTSVTSRVTASYHNVTTSKDMRFNGWAFENNGTPVITGNTIPAGAYKGKLTLYSSYEEVNVSILGAGTTTPYLFEGNTLDLTAEPSGFPAGATITYNWHIIQPGYPLVSPMEITSNNNTVTVTVSPVTGESGNGQIEVTATCGSGVNQISASKSQDIIVGVVGIGGLEAYLATLVSNGSFGSLGAPNVLPPIQGLTSSNWKQMRALLRSDEYDNIYIDMSATTLPADITDMEDGFATCFYLVKPPQLPATMNGSMKNCFERCYLTEAPVLPVGVTSLNVTFYCAKFTTAPVVPDTVTDMQNCFDGCDKLTGNVIIKANITDPNKWSCAFGTSIHPGSSSITIYVCSPDAKQAILDSVSDYSNPQITASMIKVVGVDVATWPDS